eukprot:1691475-Rhodomonas_salina.1
MNPPGEATYAWSIVSAQKTPAMQKPTTFENYVGRATHKGVAQSTGCLISPARVDGLGFDFCHLQLKGGHPQQ